MKILIVGCGKIGYSLARRLSQENHEITIVDNDETVMEKAESKLDVMCIKGSALNKDVLMEAKTNEQDVVIIVTSSDETNIICAMLVSFLSEAKIVARLRDPEYSMTGEFIKKVSGIDLILNPNRSTAHEISRFLRFPNAYSMESFAHGKMEMLEFVMNDQTPILGKPLSSVMPQTKTNVLVALVKRNGSVFTADGTTVLEKGDHIFVVGKPKQTFLFSKAIRNKRQKINTVMIIGGGSTGYYLARGLNKLGIYTLIIENDLDRCNELKKLLPKSEVLCGDGTDQELLEQEKVTSTGCFVALTNRDEENILAGLYANELNIAKVIVKVKRPFYSRLTEDLSTVNPLEIAEEKIVHFVQSIANSQGSSIETLYRVAGGKAKVMEFKVGKDKKMINIPLRNLKVKENVLIAAILHNGEIIMPDGDAIISEGDTIIVVSALPSKIFNTVHDILM